MNAELSRRGILTGAGAVLISGALAGCAASAKKPAGGKTTLQVVTAPAELDQKLIADFESKHPDITISLTQFSWDVVVSMLASGTPPDLVRGTGATDTGYLAHRGLAEPLDDRLAKSSVLKKDDLDPINDLFRYEGGTQGTGPLYGLVKDYSSDMTLWAHKAHLDAAGVPLPSAEKPLTYDQLLALAKQATKVSKGQTTVLGFGTLSGNNKPDPVWLQTMMASAGTPFFNDDLSQVDLTSAAGVSALEWFIELIRSNVTSSVLAPQASSDVDLYIAGRVATLMSGYWTSGLIASAKPELQAASHLLPAPQFGSTRISPCVAGTGMWMPKKSANKDAAWRFMEYYFGAQPAVDRAKSGWGVPGLKSLLQYLPDSAPYQQRALRTQRAESQYFKVLPFTPYAKSDALAAALATAFEAGLRKNQSAAQIAAAATTSINSLLQRGKK